jgi:thiamine-phosphate pyrophosphorylase
MTAPFRTPAICVITRGRGERGSREREALIGRLAAAAHAGATMVQVRERQFDDRELLTFVGQVIDAVRPFGMLVIVNERTDVALAARADGVHLKSNAPSVTDVRRIVPAGFIVGRSVHSHDEGAAIAAEGGCDYLMFGTVFPSASKPAGHPIAGVEALEAVCGRVRLPVLAIGGITLERASRAIEAGAAGVAAISLFADTPDIDATVRGLRSALTPRACP